MSTTCDKSQPPAMSAEVDAAVLHLRVQLLTLPRGDAAGNDRSSAARRFGDALRGSLLARFSIGRWDAEEPERGSAWRALQWHGHPGGEGRDEALVAACRAADAATSADDMLPRPFTMWIDPGCVALRMGPGPGTSLRDSAGLDFEAAPLASRRFATDAIRPSTATLGLIVVYGELPKGRPHSQMPLTATDASTPARDNQLHASAAAVPVPRLQLLPSTPSLDASCGGRFEADPSAPPAATWWQRTDGTRFEAPALQATVGSFPSTFPITLSSHSRSVSSASSASFASSNLGAESIASSRCPSLCGSLGSASVVSTAPSSLPASSGGGGGAIKSSVSRSSSIRSSSGRSVAYGYDDEGDETMMQHAAGLGFFGTLDLVDDDDEEAGEGEADTTAVQHRRCHSAATADVEADVTVCEAHRRGAKLDGGMAPASSTTQPAAGTTLSWAPQHKRRTASGSDLNFTVHDNGNVGVLGGGVKLGGGGGGSVSSGGPTASSPNRKGRSVGPSPSTRMLPLPFNPATIPIRPLDASYFTRTVQNSTEPCVGAGVTAPLPPLVLGGVSAPVAASTCGAQPQPQSFVAPPQPLSHQILQHVHQHQPQHQTERQTSAQHTHSRSLSHVYQPPPPPPFAYAAPTTAAPKGIATTLNHLPALPVPRPMTHHLPLQASQRQYPVSGVVVPPFLSQDPHAHALSALPAVKAKRVRSRGRRSRGRGAGRAARRQLALLRALAERHGQPGVAELLRDNESFLERLAAELTSTPSPSALPAVGGGDVTSSSEAAALRVSAALERLGATELQRQLAQLLLRRSGAHAGVGRGDPNHPDAEGNDATHGSELAQHALSLARLDAIARSASSLPGAGAVDEGEEDEGDEEDDECPFVASETEQDRRSGSGGDSTATTTDVKRGSGEAKTQTQNSSQSQTEGRGAVGDNDDDDDVMAVVRRRAEAVSRELARRQRAELELRRNQQHLGHFGMAGLAWSHLRPAAGAASSSSSAVVVPSGGAVGRAPIRVATRA